MFSPVGILSFPAPQVGNNPNNFVSDSDASFWDSDSPEEFKY
jgi:hypothetical protein